MRVKGGRAGQGGQRGVEAGSSWALGKRWVGDAVCGGGLKIGRDTEYLAEWVVLADLKKGDFIAKCFGCWVYVEIGKGC